jgi:hypothetical protein
MERNAKIGIAGVVLVGLGVAVYYQHKKDAALGTPASKADLPELKVPDDVDKVDIVNGSKGEVVLQKKGDKWELTKPVDAPANQTNVKSLVDNLKELKLSDIAVTGADDEAKKRYDLTPDKGIHVMAFKGADKKFDATFGKSGGLGDAMLIAGKPDIYLVKGYSSWMYGREPKDWRDREIFKLDDAAMTSIELQGKNGDFLFSKGDKDAGSSDWAGAHDKKPIPSYDASKAKTLAGAMKNLMAEDFGDGKPASETGLDAPEETVTIKMKDGATHVLKIGKTADKSSHYAQKEGDATIFTIGAYPYEWATGPLSKFQQPADAGAPDSGAKAKPRPAAPKPAAPKPAASKK